MSSVDVPVANAVSVLHPKSAALGTKAFSPSPRRHAAVETQDPLDNPPDCSQRTEPYGQLSTRCVTRSLLNSAGEGRKKIHSLAMSSSAEVPGKCHQGQGCGRDGVRTSLPCVEHHAAEKVTGHSPVRSITTAPRTLMRYRPLQPSLSMPQQRSSAELLLATCASESAASK